MLKKMSKLQSVHLELLSNQELYVYTPGELRAIIEESFSNIINSRIPERYIGVKGTIGKWKDKPVYGQTIYGIPLNGDDGSVIKLSANQKELADCVPGKLVIAYGFLRPRYFNSQLEISLSCTRIVQEQISEQIKVQETTLYELITSCRRYRKDFPLREKYRIAVIYARNSHAIRDFKESIAGLMDSIELDEIAINIQNSDELQNAISSAGSKSFDIVCLIRGGGEEWEFNIFNQPSVIEKWISIDAYTISALGHTSHRTAIDIFSDRDCITPTKAGLFVYENIKHILDSQELLKTRYELELKTKNLQQDLDKSLKELDKNLKILQFYKRAFFVSLLVLALIAVFFIASH